MTAKRTSTSELSMVERVAEALYTHAVKRTREQIAAEALPIEKIGMVFNEAVAASDRESAIVLFCLVDDLATEFFRRKLTGKVNGGVDQTFLTGNGMLSSAYNKIALLAGLQWISNETYRALTLMRRVRNEFAHNVEYRSFETQPICSYIASMDRKETSILNALADSEKPAGLLLRSKFLVRSSLAIMGLVQDLVFIQAAISNQVDPRSVSTAFEEAPENMKALALAVSEIALRVISSQTKAPSEEPPA